MLRRLLECDEYDQHDCSATSACLDIGDHTITFDGHLIQSDNTAKWKISGTGTLSGYDATKIFHNYGTLELSGITLRDGNGKNGAVMNAGTLIAKGVTFKNNYAAGNGGAIYVMQGSLLLIDCVFMDNFAGSVGDDVYFDGGFGSRDGAFLYGNAFGGSVFKHSAANGAITSAGSCPGDTSGCSAYAISGTPGDGDELYSCATTWDGGSCAVCPELAPLAPAGATKMRECYAVWCEA
jgi:predicted outer membrane repeat protein